ncbi:MAG: endonuclease/exonuclease/phosphatase family protein, partial [Solirubrobacteraceae bacterium]
QELTPDAATRLDAAGGRGVFPGRAVEARPGAAGSGLYARLPLGRRSPDDATDAEQPEAELRLPGARPVRIKAVHPRPPISARSERDWRRSIARLPRPGSEPRGPLRLIAGDFNATLDHGALRDLLSDGYVDAADATGNGLLSTWSNGLTGPPITIDHVLLDQRLGVRSFSVHEVPGSDHRAVVAELVLPRG